MPGGALLAIEDGVLEEADAIFMLHCDPSVDVGTIGLREGPITGAADAIDVQLRGTGGHTSRPHLTQDLTFALGKLVTELPAALSRRLDPRAGASVVWGVVQAGKAKNVIPATGHAGGTVRMLDAVAWADAEARDPRARRARSSRRTAWRPWSATSAASPRSSTSRAPPPCSPGSRARCSGPSRWSPPSRAWAARTSRGTSSGSPARCSASAPVRPGGPTYDLHQGNLRVDDRAVGIGARLLARAALATIATRLVTDR